MDEKILEEFIREELARGTDPKTLKEMLVDKGYDPALIDKFIRPEQDIPETVTPKKEEEIYEIPEKFIPKKEEEKPKPPEEWKTYEEIPMPIKSQKNKVDKKLWIIVLVLGIVITSLFLGYFLIFPEFKGKGKLGIFPNPEEFKNVNIDINKLEIISANPDLIFKGYDWGQGYSYEMDNVSFSQIFYPWHSNGGYYDGYIPELSDKTGVVIIHPIDVTTPRYLTQDITLPAKHEFYLVVEAANIADYIKKPCKEACSDAIVKIIITSPTARKAMFEKVLDSRNGWQTLVLNISSYAGIPITLSIEGHAGGPCSDWCGEWLGVNKFYVGQL